jgi:predicted nuclease with TOPRIM domain
MYKPFHKSQETLIDFRKFRAKTDNRRVVDIVSGIVAAFIAGLITTLISKFVTFMQLKAEIKAMRKDYEIVTRENSTLKKELENIEKKNAALRQHINNVIIVPGKEQSQNDLGA